MKLLPKIILAAITVSTLFATLPTAAIAHGNNYRVFQAASKSSKSGVRGGSIPSGIPSASKSSKSGANSPVISVPFSKEAVPESPSHAEMTTPSYGVTEPSLLSMTPALAPSYPPSKSTSQIALNPTVISSRNASDAGIPDREEETTIRSPALAPSYSPSKSTSMHVITSRPSVMAPEKSSFASPSPTLSRVLSLPFFIRNTFTDKLLTSAICIDGNDVRLWQDVGAYWQQWVFNKVDRSIESAHCHGMVLDIDGPEDDSTCENRTSIVIAHKDRNNRKSQLWHVHQDGLIESVRCRRMVLSIEGNTTNGRTGTPIQLRPAYLSEWVQSWELDPVTPNNNSSANDFYLSVNPTSTPRPSPSVGPVMPNNTSSASEFYPSVNPPSMPRPLPTMGPNTNSSSATNFSSTVAPESLRPSTRPEVIVQDSHSGKLITISDGLCRRGNNIQIWDDLNLDSQRWLFQRDNSIESVHCPGMVLDLDAYGSTCENGLSIVLAGKDRNRRGQLWYLHVRRDGTMIESILCRRMVVDVQGYPATNGAPLHLWETRFNQVWQMNPVNLSTNNETAPPSTNPNKSDISYTSPSFNPNSSFSPTPLINPTIPPTESPTFILPKKNADITTKACVKGECVDLSGKCATEVQCFVNPCEVTSCGDSSYCIANFCGGCHAICTPINS